MSCALRGCAQDLTFYLSGHEHVLIFGTVLPGILDVPFYLGPIWRVCCLHGVTSPLLNATFHILVDETDSIA